MFCTPKKKALAGPSVQSVYLLDRELAHGTANFDVVLLDAVDRS